MRIAQCTRCDQLIEYDASYEGEEVLCPGCDNITRLKEIPPDELPDLEPEESPEDTDSSRPSRAPLRIAADAIPKPDHDPVAPLKADENTGLRGPDSVKNEPAPIDRDAPISERPNPPSKKLSKVLNEGKTVDVPAGSSPEIKILEGPAAVAFFGGDTPRRDGTITIPAKVAIPIVVLLAVLVLALKFWPEKDHQAEGRERTARLRAQIEAKMAKMRARVQNELNKQEEDAAMVVQAASAGAPSRSLVELLEERRQMQRSERTFVGTNVVTVMFPEVPSTVQRAVTKFEDEAYQAYVESALKLPYRLFDDTVIDLRTLGFAMRRGMIDFADKWKLLGGVVIGKQEDGLLMRLDRRYYLESRLVFIEGFPNSLGYIESLPLGVLGRQTDDREMELEDGDKQTVEVYEFGLLPSKLMIEVVQMKALEREKITRTEIAMVERKKAEKTQAEEEAKQRANDRRAVEYLRKRMKEGSASAEYSLGVRYLEGAGVPKDRNQALRHIRNAAKKGVYAAKKKLEELEK